MPPVFAADMCCRLAPSVQIFAERGPLQCQDMSFDALVPLLAAQTPLRQAKMPEAP